MRTIAQHTLNITLVLLLTAITAQAQNWPQWRGPGADGIAPNGEYPVSFSATEGIIWKAELPGKGGSTPIVWGDRIILTSAIGEGTEGEDGVLCYDWNGKLLWQVKLGKQSPGRHARGTGSNPSAITDGERIFVKFKSGTLAALDLDGKVLWKTNLQESYVRYEYFWDFGTSPVLVGNNVVVAVMHEGSSYLLALDQATGKVVWKVDRNYQSGRETPQSYTTPLVVKDGNRTTIVVWGADHLTGHDAATGEMIWSYGGFNPAKTSAWRTIASPVHYQGIYVVPYGRGRFTAAMKTGSTNGQTESDFMWQKTGVGSDVATPVARDGMLYVLGFNSVLWCLDINTGEQQWEATLPGEGGVFYSSPTLAGDKLYIANDRGAVYVCKVSRAGIELLNHTVFEDNFVATPVLLRDKLLLRGTKYLYCIGK